MGPNPLRGRPQRDPRSSAASQGRARPKPGRRTPRPRMEELEERTLLSATLTGVPQWVAQGPAPINDGGPGGNNTASSPVNNSVGAVESIAVAPNHSGNLVYAGTVNGGVWRTDNFNAADPKTIHWRPLTDQEPSLSTSSLALDPRDPTGNTLWVGTGSLSSSNFQGGPGVGLLRTTDGGVTWTHLGRQLNGQRITAVIPFNDPTTGKPVVLVAAYDGDGIQRSTDGGVTFHPALVDSFGSEQTLSGQADSLVADPLNPRRFYATLAYQGPKQPNHGVFRSDDAGLHWVPIDNAMPAMTTSPALKLTAQAYGGTTVVYVITTYKGGKYPTGLLVGNVFRSAISPAGNAQWTTVAQATLPSDAPDVGMLEVVADPTDPYTVYMDKLVRGDARPSGVWTPIYTANDQPHADVRDLVFSNNTTILAATDGGIYSLPFPRLYPNNVLHLHWTTRNGDMADVEFYSVAYDSATGTSIGGAQDNGVSAQSAPGSTKWNLSAFSAGGDGGFVAVDDTSVPGESIRYINDQNLSNFTRQTFNSLALFPGSPPALLSSATVGLVDTAAGKTLAAVEGSVPFQVPFVLDAGNPKRMLIGVNSTLYESNDRGDKLTSLGSIGAINPGPGYESPLAYGTAGNADVIWAGGGGDLWLRTGGFGTKPTRVAAYAQAGGAAVKSLVMDPEDSATIYVLDSNNHVWKGVKSGATKEDWTDLTDDLGFISSRSTGTTDLRTIALYDPTPGRVAGDGVLLVGGLGGVYRDIGTVPGCKWTLYGAGLPNVVVTDLHAIRADAKNFLLAGTFGRGAWTIEANDVTTPGRLTVTGDDGPTPNDTIILGYDPADAADIQVLDLATGVQYDGPYTSLSTITIDSGGGRDQVDVEAIPRCLAVTTIQSGAGTVTVGEAGQLRAILGSLMVTNPSGTTTLDVEDPFDTSGHPIAITSSGIFGAAPGPIDYQPAGLAALNVFAGGGGTTFSIPSTPDHGAPGAVTTTLTSRGRDTVNVGLIVHPIVTGRIVTTEDARSILGALSIKNAAALTTLNVYDGNDTTVRDVTITASAITGLAPAPIRYVGSELAALNIDGSAGYVPGGTIRGRRVPAFGNIYRVLGTPRSSNPADPLVTTLTTPGKDDAVFVGNSGSVKGVLGTLAIVSPNRSTSLAIDAERDFTPPPAKGVGRVVPVVISSTGVSGLAPAAITFAADQLTGLTVGPPQGGRLVDVLSTPNHGAIGSVVTNLIDNDSDTVTVGDSGRLGGIQGTLVLTNPQDFTALTVDDSADPAGRTVTVGPGLIRGFAPADITYGPGVAKSIALLGGPGGNTFRLQAGATPPATIDGGSGANTLVGPDDANAWHVTGGDAGFLGNVTFARVGSLTGGALADTFLLRRYGGLSGRIDGGPGVNTVDMSGKVRDVAVNLALGTATGVGGGIADVEDAVGGKAASLLVGDGRVNVLTGGAGPNLLIGGDGADQVIGGAGDNILIGGVTAYDLVPAALDALMLEFAGTDGDFLTRLTHLLGGDGANGPTLLNPATVRADPSANFLSGGPGNNWFFARAGVDTITPGTLRPGNVVTKL